MKPCRKIYYPTKFDNLRDIIKNSIKLYADNNAFIIKNKNENENEEQTIYTNITYKKFEEDINRLGTKLKELGLKRIAIIGKNSYRWALSFITVLCGVGITVPLDRGLPETEIESLLERSKADGIIFSKEYIELMRKIKLSNNNIKQFICIEDEKLDGYSNINDLLEQGEELLKKGNRDYLNAQIDINAMTIILFTSGTTSLSKAVMLSHKNIATNIYDMNCTEKVYSSDVNLAFLPFHHIFASTGVLFFLSNGATNVFCDGLRHIAHNLKEYKVSIFTAVPLILEAMYKKIMIEIEKKGKTKLIKIVTAISKILLKMGIDIRRKVFKEIIDSLGGGIRFVISGAAALDKKVSKAFNDFGILTVQGYGLTETSPVLAAENAKAIKYGSCGIAMLSVDLKIDSPNQEGIGEIIAKGPSVMLGYYENEEATKEVLIDGWFHTGDLGYIDKEGFLFITGRKKNVIISKNGKNIYPEEIELLINKLKYVEESMVFGKEKDNDLILSAKIVYNEEYINEKYPNITKEELKEIIWKDIKEINKGLTTYKYIKNIIITSEAMIKTTSAKIKRHEEIKKDL